MIKLVPFCDLWEYNLSMSSDDPRPIPWWLLIIVTLIMAGLLFIPIAYSFYLIAKESNNV